MKVIFYGNRYGNWADKLIRFKTATWKQRVSGEWKDLPSHCELLFDNGQMFSASFRENIVGFKEHSYTGKAWCRLDIDLTDSQVLQVGRFAREQVGKKYDYLGILGFILPFVHQVQSRWFCSEVCSEALKQVDYLELQDSAKVSPAKLKQLVLFSTRPRTLGE